MKKLKQTYPLHNTLTGYDFRTDKPLSPAKSIRAKCLECCGNDPAAVRGCHICDCTLYPYRSGRRQSTSSKEGGSAKAPVSQSLG